jgi:hypothetical protein
VRDWPWVVLKGHRERLKVSRSVRHLFDAM